MGQILYYILFLNPIYLLAHIIVLQYPGFGTWVARILFIVFSYAIWGIIAWLIAEHMAKKRGVTFLWFIVLLVFNIWFYILYAIFDKLTSVDHSAVARGAMMASDRNTPSSIVGSAIDSYSPAEYREFEIQDMADRGQIDEALSIARNRLEQANRAKDEPQAQKWASITRWLEVQIELNDGEFDLTL